MGLDPSPDATKSNCLVAASANQALRKLATIEQNNQQKEKNEGHWPQPEYEADGKEMAGGRKE